MKTIIYFFLIFSNFLFGQTTILKEAAGVYIQSDSLTITKLGYKVNKVSNIANRMYCEIPKQENNNSTVAFLKSKGIQSWDLADAVVEVHSDTIPDYLKYPQKMWNLQTTGFFNNQILDFLKYGESNSTIFVLDTGHPIDSLNNLHPFLQQRGKIKLGGNYVPFDTLNLNNWDNTSIDRHGHASWVGGIVSYLNRKDTIIFIKVLGAGGWGYWSWIEEAIQEVINYATATKRTAIINASWGGPAWQPLEYLCAYMDSLRIYENINIYLIASAGNGGSPFSSFPAAYSHWGELEGHNNGYDNIISVGAINLDKTKIVRANYSNHGRSVDIFAPGGKNAFHDPEAYLEDGRWYRYDSMAVLGLAPIYNSAMDYLPRLKEDTTWRYAAGTSASAPHIVGIFANYLRHSPDAVNILKSRIIKAGKDFIYKGNPETIFYSGKYLYIPSLLADLNLKYRYTDFEGWYGPLHKENSPPFLGDYTFVEDTRNFTLEVSKDVSPMLNQDLQFSTFSLKFSLLAPQSSSHSMFMLILDKEINMGGGLQVDYKLDVDKEIPFDQWKGTIHFNAIIDNQLYGLTPPLFLYGFDKYWRQNSVRFYHRLPTTLVDTILVVFLDGSLSPDINKYYFIDNLYSRTDTLGGWTLVSTLGEKMGNLTSVGSFSTLDYKLYQNYPNPFNPNTTIQYTISKAGNVKLIIYDILGRETKILVNEYKQAGNYQITFNAKNLSSGVYFYKLQTSEFLQIRKMVIIK